MINFDDCIRSGKVKQGESDPSMAESLLKQARQRLADVEDLPLSNETASFRFEGAYESVREAVQSLMAAEGLKPYSHEAVVAYAEKVGLLSESGIYSFDRYREIRNDINYRGVKTSVEEAREVISFAKKVVAVVVKKHQM